MNEPLYFSVSSETVSNHNCGTCLSCACVGNFPISSVTLAMLSEIYYELGQVSWQQWIYGVWKTLWVNNPLNIATLFIKNLYLRLAQNTVTPPCLKKSHLREAGRRVYNMLSRSVQHSMRSERPSIVNIQYENKPFNLGSHSIISHSI